MKQEFRTMRRSIWTVVLSVIVSYIIKSGTAQSDAQCETAVIACNGAGDPGCGSFPYNPAILAETYHAYTACTAAFFECNDGSCVLEGEICDGGNDCPDGEEEIGCGIASCATDSCPNPFTVVEGELVTWSPPSGVPSSYELVSDPDHFPGTTFPPGVMTPVTYRIYGPVPFHICRFEVMVTAGATPAIDASTCRNENLVVTADVGASSAITTWTEPTSPVATAVVTINNEDYRPGNSFPIGFTKVEYTITDTATGDESYCAFYVVVNENPDAVGPSITCIAPVTITIDPPAETGSAQTELEAMLATVQDAISVITSHPTNYAFPIGTTNFLVGLTDEFGNSHSGCTTSITVQYPVDDTPPVIANCPSGVTVCYKTGDTVARGAWTEPTATDNVSVKSESQTVEQDNYLSIPTVAPYTTTVTYTFTDWADNTATCHFDLSFQADTLAPVITNCNNYTEYTTQTTGSITANYPDPTITDNCDQYQVTVTPDTGKVFDVESVQRLTYTVTDDADNTATCDFTVEVRIDQIPEFANCPLSMIVPTETGETSADVAWKAPQITDDNQLEVDNVEVSIVPMPDPPIVLDPFEDQELTLEKGVYTVVYSYTDVNLQTGECPFTITVQDSEAPVLDCPGDMQVTLGALAETRTVTWEYPTADDNDGDSVAIEIQNSQYQSGNAFRAGEYTIVYVGTDQSGNEGFCSFILTVYPYDTSNFWINCTNDIRETTDPGHAYATVQWDPPDLRASIELPRYTNTHSPGSPFGIGDTRVEYIVTDVAQNSGVCSFTVTVLDHEPPVIIGCPGDCTIYGLSGRDNVPAFWTEPRTSDNSGGTVSLNANPFGSGTDFGFGTHQVYYTAVDPSGNSVTGCHFQVTVTQPGDTHIQTGSSVFSSIRGASSTSAVSEAANLADDLDRLFRQNTAISKLIAGVQVGTPSPLSDGDLLVPFTLYFAECRAAYLHVRDSLTLNLEGNNRNSFDSNNIILPETFQLNTREFLVTSLIIAADWSLPVDQQELNFNGDYNNPRTSAYQYLEDRVCDTMDQLFSSFTGYCGCDIWRFSAGSIVSELVLIFADGSSVSQSALESQIENAINPNDNTLNQLLLENQALTTVTEVCPDGYCQNGGTCEPNAATYLSRCSCPTDYTGTNCQTFTGDNGPDVTQAPGDDGTGLSTEEIIGIVVGVVGGLLLLIILLACFCVFCLRPTEPKPQPIIQEPPEPFYAVNPQRQKVLVRDVMEPPPIGRPVPVRIPEPFPVPFRAPVPVPVPVPRPVPRPVPIPIRQPIPVGVPVPVPQAVPRNVPVPFRQPFGVPTQVPVPVPQPVPVPTPVRMPYNVGVPVREAVPVLQPFGVPTVSRQPFGPAMGSGFGPRLGSNLNGLNAGLNSGFGLNGLNGLNGYNTTGF